MQLDNAQQIELTMQVLDLVKRYETDNVLRALDAIARECARDPKCKPETAKIWTALQSVLQAGLAVIGGKLDVQVMLRKRNREEDKETI